jgi:hypothetical protein
MLTIFLKNKIGFLEQLHIYKMLTEITSSPDFKKLFLVEILKG